MSEQHTEGAMRAAKRITGYILAKDIKNDWTTDQIAIFIDQETGLPEITAERDRLREALQDIASTDKTMVEVNGADATINHIIGWAKTALAKVHTELPELQARIEELEAERHEILRAWQIDIDHLKAEKAEKAGLVEMLKRTDVELCNLPVPWSKISDTIKDIRALVAKAKPVEGKD